MRNKSFPRILARDRNSQRGAVLILVLVAVTVLGLTAGIAGQTWRSIGQRAKEAELLWRGQQYYHAFESYYTAAPGRKEFPSQLEDLLSDNRFPEPKRHIRRLYTDPMTGEEWDLVMWQGKVRGVRSRSTLRPFKQDGFVPELKSLVNKSKYSEWQFVYKPGQTKANQNQQKPAAAATDTSQ